MTGNRLSSRAAVVRRNADPLVSPAKRARIPPKARQEKSVASYLIVLVLPVP